MKKLTKTGAFLFFGAAFPVAMILAVHADTNKSADPPVQAQTTDDKTIDHQGTPVLSPSSYWIGVRIVPVPDILLSHFGVKEKGRGLIVVEQILPKSPAAKAGLQRGDVVLQFGGKDIGTLFDLVEQVDIAKDNEQKISIMRDGQKMELSVVPEPRPDDRLALSGPSMLHGIPMMRHPGLKLGPEIRLGSGDPRQMMRDMEEYFRQMQGGVDGEQLLILPEEDANTGTAQDDGSAPSTGMQRFSKRLEIASGTDENGKPTIRVKQIRQDGDKMEEKTWEAGSIDELPEEIRPDVKAMFGR